MRKSVSRYMKKKKLRHLSVYLYKQHFLFVTPTFFLGLPENFDNTVKHVWVTNYLSMHQDSSYLSMCKDSSYLSMHKDSSYLSMHKDSSYLSMHKDSCGLHVVHVVLLWHIVY